jgi:hypothetical protein
MALRRGRLLVLALLTAVASASCSSAPTPQSFSLPPASAGAEVVLDAYLRALVAGDCADGRKLTTATFVKGNGELCGDTHVSDYKINPEPGGGGTEQVFATTLATSGTSDGSIHAGTVTWFYQLDQQPDGSWRIAGGGSGP